MDLNGLLKNTEEIADRAHLESALASGKKLRVKFGIDPTAPDLHLGHTVPLRKLRAFQDAGHTAVLIIGDFTAMIGDPAGKSVTRPVLTKEQVTKNATTYLAQAGKVIDIAKAEIHHNSEWLADSLPQLIKLFNKISIQQVLHRADFKKRMEGGTDISMLEIMYPLLQGYDSVASKADVEIGGTDQTFNMLIARRVERAMNVSEQDVMSLPLIEGTDGIQKMSKSLGNSIALTDAPKDMFGKIMSVPDALMPKYFALLTDSTMPTDMKPRDTKALLARTITTMYHGTAAGENAERNFTAVFSQKKQPDEIPELPMTNVQCSITELLLKAGIKSRAEARRLIEHGGVKIDGVTITDTDGATVIKDGSVLQIGKLQFFKIKK